MTKLRMTLGSPAERSPIFCAAPAHSFNRAAFVFANSVPRPLAVDMASAMSSTSAQTRTAGVENCRNTARELTPPTSENTLSYPGKIWSRSAVNRFLYRVMSVISSDLWRQSSRSPRIASCGTCDVRRTLMR